MRALLRCEAVLKPTTGAVSEVGTLALARARVIRAAGWGAEDVTVSVVGVIAAGLWPWAGSVVLALAVVAVAVIVALVILVVAMVEDLVVV